VVQTEKKREEYRCSDGESGGQGGKREDGERRGVERRKEEQKSNDVEVRNGRGSVVFSRNGRRG